MRYKAPYISKTTRAVIMLFLSGIGSPLLACELCESRQPAMWRGITHGPGPEGNLDHIITWSAIVIVAATLCISIRLLVRPQESKPGHIKQIVVEEN